MIGEHIAPQSEVIRAMFLEDSPYCGRPHLALDVLPRLPLDLRPKLRLLPHEAPRVSLQLQ